MKLRPAPIWLLSVAILAAGGCRTRLPVEPAVAAAPTRAPAPRRVEATSSGIAAFLRGDVNLERGPAEASDPTRPFLADFKPDRLRDMVRLDRFTDRRRGSWGFLTASAQVCVPAHHR